MMKKAKGWGSSCNRNDSDSLAEFLVNGLTSKFAIHDWLC